MHRLLLVGLLTLLSQTVFSAPEIKGSPQDLRGFLYPNDRVVTINGEAEEKAYSDRAIVSLVISTESKLLSESISKNGTIRKNITDALIKTGIDRGSIKSSKFSSSPQYGWFGSKPSSYKVVNRMAISISEESHLKEIALVADKSADVELSDTSFEHSKKDEFNAAVRAKALEKILKQKQYYENTLGVTLSPIGIRDANIHHRATRGAMTLEKAVLSSARPEGDSYSSVAKVRRPSTEPSFDELIYQANMSLDFKIEN